MSYLVANPEDRFSHDKADVGSQFSLHWIAHEAGNVKPTCEPRHEKTCLRFFDQVRLEPAYSATQT